MTVSRNAPCPCGSGKKYKRCCGLNASAEAAMTADQLFRQAMQFQQQGQTIKAVESCQTALKKAPNHQMGYALLAQLRTFVDDNKGAAEAFAKSLDLGLKDPAINFHYGNVLLALGRIDDAIQQFEQALILKPDLVEAHINLGNIYLELEQYTKAEQYHRKATELRPNYWKAHAQLAASLTNLIRHDEAMMELNKALAAAPQQLGLYTQQAKLKEKSNKLDEAEALLTKAQLISPDSASVRMLESQLKLRRKDYPAAWQAISKIDLNEDDEQIEDFAANLASLRGNILDKLKRYDEALRNYQLANERMASKRVIRYDTEKTRQRFANETNYFSKEKYNELTQNQPELEPLELTPIFIVGFPRSGTTLAEQILGSHPDIVAAGELGFISEIHQKLSDQLDAPYPQCLDKLKAQPQLINELRHYYVDEVGKLNLPSTGKRWVTDKMPLNLLHLPLIHLLFPESPLINTLRHPMDSALSCFFQLFHSRGLNWSFNLNDTVDFFSQAWAHADDSIRKLSLPVYTLRYETLVENPEPLVREMLDWVGADWNPTCLDFHKTTRVARTASYAQVNQPIYTGSKLRYLHYQPFVDKSLLHKMQATAEAMGYEIQL